jgi:hypothetical protein
VNTVGSDDIIEDFETKTLSGLEQPMKISLAVFRILRGIPACGIYE